MTNPSFTCHAAALKRALAFAGSVVQRRNTIPVLGMVCVKVGGDTGYMIGTDLDAEAHHSFPVISRSGTGVVKFTIEPRMLRHVLGSLADDAEVSVEIETDKQGNVVVIRADGMTVRSRVLCPADDFPEMQFAGGGKTAVISKTHLRETLQAVQPCISTEVTRYYLNGVFMHDKGDGLLACATDGFVLSLMSAGAAWGLPDAIWPRAMLPNLIRQLGAGSDAELVVWAELRATSWAPKFMVAAHDAEGCVTWRLTFKTIDGAFPDYTRAMPKWEAKARATLTAAAIRRIPKFAGEPSQPVKLDTGAATMTSADASSGVEITQPLTSSGEAVQISINRRYLATFARQSQTLQLELHSANEPARVLCSDPRLLRVVMPMRV